jgi:predicted esterase
MADNQGHAAPVASVHDRVLELDEDAHAVKLRSADTGDSFWQFLAPPPGEEEGGGGDGANQNQQQQQQQQRRRRRRRRPPRRSAFPAPLRTFSYHASADGTDANLLVLLHGLGDSHAPFAQLGRTFALPQTAVLAVRAPFALPFDLGHGWFEAIDLARGGDPIRPDVPGEARRRDSLAACLGLLEGLLEALAAVGNDDDGAYAGGWRPEEVFLFGFAQGGTVALEWALRRWRARREALGGVVAVAAGLLEERTWWHDEDSDLSHYDKEDSVDQSSNGSGDGEKKKKEKEKAEGKTPCLVVAGEKDPVCPLSWVMRSVELYNSGDSSSSSSSSSSSNHLDAARRRKKDRQAPAAPNTGVPATMVSIPGKGHGMLGEGAGGSSSSSSSGSSSSSSSSGVRDHEMAAVMGFFSEHLHRRSQLEDDADVYEVPQGR